MFDLIYLINKEFFIHILLLYQTSDIFLICCFLWLFINDWLIILWFYIFHSLVWFWIVGPYIGFFYFWTFSSSFKAISFLNILRVEHVFMMYLRFDIGLGRWWIVQAMITLEFLIHLLINIVLFLIQMWMFRFFSLLIISIFSSLWLFAFIISILLLWRVISITNRMGVLASMAFFFLKLHKFYQFFFYFSLLCIALIEDS